MREPSADPGLKTGALLHKQGRPQGAQGAATCSSSVINTRSCQLLWVTLNAGHTAVVGLAILNQMGAIMAPHKSSHEISSADRATAIGRARAKIAKYGWTVIGVQRPMRAEQTPLSYTCGLTEKGLPELAIYGLPVPAAATILNDVAHRVVSMGSPWRTGAVLGRVASGWPLVAVEMVETGELSLARDLYGREPWGVQVCWPDPAGVMLWEDGSSLTAAQQPLRGVPPESRRAGRAARKSAGPVEELLSLFAQEPVSVSAPPRARNRHRARAATAALGAYARRVGKRALVEEPDTVLMNLLSDMRHLFDALGFSWAEAVRAADMHYHAEIRDPQ